jgi:hypothetical protein
MRRLPTVSRWCLTPIHWPEPGVHLYNAPGSPSDLTTLVRCASSSWIFRICTVSTVTLYSVRVAVELAPFAL